MQDLERRIAKLEEIARTRGGLDPSIRLVVILRPGDPDPELPEGSRPLIIDCRHSEPLPDPMPDGVVIDAQDLRL